MPEITLDSLRADSQQAINLANDALDEQNNTYKPDPRFWKPNIDKEGNSESVIRFLPNAHGTTPPFIPIHKFQFKMNNKWYINNSRETIKQPDPCNELTLSDLNNPAVGKEVLRQQGRMRKTVNIANILVIKDKFNPANEGKVMLYEFTRQILDKLQEAINPKYDEKAINVFDLEAAPDFIVRTKKQNGMINYLDSKFTTDLKPIADTQDGILEIARQTIDLYEFRNPANFKSYEELKTQLDYVMGNVNTGFGNTPYQPQPQQDAPPAGHPASMPTGNPQENLEAQAPWIAPVENTAAPNTDFKYPEPPNVTENTATATTSAEPMGEDFFRNALDKQAQ